MAFRGLSRPNATSGMGVADHSKETFLELKRKKIYRYVIFKIEEKKRAIVVEKAGGPAESYDDFVAAMPENDCRYAVYDYDFVTSDNCQKSKIFFIAWSPSSSRIRSKMLYATSKDTIRRELDGVHYEIQATDPTEMDLEVLRDRAQGKTVSLKREILATACKNLVHHISALSYTNRSESGAESSSS